MNSTAAQTITMPKVRILLKDRNLLELTNAMIRTDSIVGNSTIGSHDRTAIALSDVEAVESRDISWGKTGALAGGAGAGVGIGIAALIAFGLALMTALLMTIASP